MAFTFRTFKKKWKDRQKRLKRARKELGTIMRFHPLYLKWSLGQVAKRLRGEVQELPGIVPTIDRGDRMYKKGSGQVYFHGGFQALITTRRALAEAGAGEIRAILDFACGHGRVMRVMRAAWPQAKIVACDLEKEAVDFCAKSFGAIPVYSAEDPSAMEMPMKFDLIWVGSLFTHLDGVRWKPFLDLLSRSLAPGGVLVFTTHGERIAARARAGEYRFGLQPDDLKGLLADYEQTGFAYRDYQPGCNYGTSLSRPSWVKQTIASVPDLEMVTFWEKGWGQYQDAVVCKRPR